MTTGVVTYRNVYLDVSMSLCERHRGVIGNAQVLHGLHRGQCLVCAEHDGDPAAADLLAAWRRKCGAGKE